MNLLQQIKDDQLKARQSDDRITASLLTVIIGECGRVGKDLSSAEVQTVIGKIVKNSKETLSYIDPNSMDYVMKGTVLKTEIEILERYLPKALTEDVIKAIIAEYKVKGYNLGQIMKVFKDNYPGQYDGKLVSQLAKSKD